MTRPAAVMTPIAVIWMQDSWRLLHSGRRWGTFEYQVDAVEAAIRLARQSAEQGARVEVLVHERWGALSPLQVA